MNTQILKNLIFDLMLDVSTKTDDFAKIQIDAIFNINVDKETWHWITAFHYSSSLDLITINW